MSASPSLRIVSEYDLPKLVGHVVGVAENDRETILARIFNKILVRHSGVLYQPLFRRESRASVSICATGFVGCFIGLISFAGFRFLSIFR
jgi:hypothetical protein